MRLGRRPDGSWYRGRGPGRGAWVCPGCVPALAPRALARALRLGVEEVDLEGARALAGETTEVVEE